MIDGIVYSATSDKVVGVPKLWNETIEAHRRTVRDAIMTAAWALVNEHGLASLTMSEIAARAGVVRATLYKYFPDVETILRAWHERHVHEHLVHLAAIAGQADDPAKRLETVLEAYANIVHKRGQQGPDLLGLLHPSGSHADAQQQLLKLLEGILRDAAEAGAVRNDIPPTEAARYCLHALGAAGQVRSAAAARRIVQATLRALSLD